MKKILFVSAVSVATMASFSALADTFTASISVSNAITINEDAVLDFGTFFAKPDGDAADIAKIAFNPDGTYGTVAVTDTTSGDAANMISVIPGTPGQFSVAGLPSFTPLNIEVGDDVTGTAGSAMTLSTGAPGAPVFTIDAWAGEVVVGSSPAGTSMDLTGTVTENADASGNFTFALGADISTDATANGSSYTDNATYQGTYFVTVSY